MSSLISIGDYHIDLWGLPGSWPASFLQRPRRVLCHYYILILSRYQTLLFKAWLVLRRLGTSLLDQL